MTALIPLFVVALAMQIIGRYQNRNGLFFAGLVLAAACALAPLASRAATSRGGPLAITFTATVIPSSELAIEQHDLGNGMFSAVAAYRESGPYPRHETIEMLAMAGDRVEFDATGSTLVAMRIYRDAGGLMLARGP